MTGIFRHGVASFDPSSTAVLLWTRITPSDAPRAGTWRVHADPERRREVASGRFRAQPDDDGTVTVEVDDLDPATTYFYEFELETDRDTDNGRPVGNTVERSMLGRTRTLPADATEQFRCGVTCCADYSAAPLGVYRALGEREVDVVVHLGDYIYEAQTSRSGRRAEFRETCTDLDGYRARYAQLRTDPDVQYLHARHPMITIWDDHDLADNAWRTGAKAHDPEEHGDWDERVGAAARARAEWLPIRYRDPDDHRRTWRSIAIGDLADLVLLDTRYEGRDRHAGDEGTAPRDDPDRSLLGDDQRAFVDERLADTSRPWSIVASGVVVNEISLPLPGDGHLPTPLLPNGYAILDGKVVHDDQWDGYTAERDHLTEAMRTRAGDGARTVLLSGDVHSCWAFEGPLGPDGEPVAVEAVCPAASSAAMGRANVALVNRVLDHSVRRMPEVQWANLTERGYLLVDVDRERVEFQWWIVDPYADDPGGEAECAAVRRLHHETWPCRFDVVDEDDPSAPAPDRPRDDLPAGIPRPDDLRTLRRTRFARLTAKTAGAAAIVVALVAGAGVAVGRAGRS